jgi:Protein of unknown function (DUF2911)
MKIISLLFLNVLALSGAGVYSQSLRGMDKSPMDMAFFPDNFAHDRKDGESAIVRVIYSRPQKDGRDVFGKLVPYGKVWRTGANEATEIMLYQDVTFNGHLLPKGRYSLFTIPGSSEWTIIFNSDLDYWGAYSYDKDKDVLRIPAKASQASESAEAFTIQFGRNGEKLGVMKLVWDKTEVDVPFTY